MWNLSARSCGFLLDAQGTPNKNRPKRYTQLIIACTCLIPPIYGFHSTAQRSADIFLPPPGLSFFAKDTMRSISPATLD